MAKLKPIGHLTARQAMWNAMRGFAADGRHWQAADLAKASGASVKSVHFYLSQLQRAGIVSAHTPCVDRRRRLFTLARDLGVEAPRIGSDGAVIEVATGQERLWAAMKSLSEFTAADLSMTAEVGVESAKTYVIRLAGAGYLVPTGKKGGYRLLAKRNTGPRAPAVRYDKTVFDPNLGRVMSAEARP